jgi:hypothetical protein
VERAKRVIDIVKDIIK